MQVPQGLIQKGCLWSAPAVCVALAVELVITSIDTPKKYKKNAFGIKMPRGTLGPKDTALMGPKFLQDIHDLTSGAGAEMRLIIQAALIAAWREAVTRDGACLTAEQEAFLVEMWPTYAPAQDESKVPIPGCVPTPAITWQLTVHGGGGCLPWWYRL